MKQLILAVSLLAISGYSVTTQASKSHQSVISHHAGEKHKKVQATKPVHHVKNRHSLARQSHQSTTASWYGSRFHGRPTSSGELYNMYALTAAHRSLPLNSYARVTNLRNHRSVVVRINDRGSFHGRRGVDLSYAAAKEIGMNGISAVTITPLGFN